MMYIFGVVNLPKHINDEYHSVDAFLQAHVNYVYVYIGINEKNDANTYLTEQMCKEK